MKSPHNLNNMKKENTLKIVSFSFDNNEILIRINNHFDYYCSIDVDLCVHERSVTIDNLEIESVYNLKTSEDVTEFEQINEKEIANELPNYIDWRSFELDIMSENDNW